MVHEYKVGYSLRFTVNRDSQFRRTSQIKPHAGAPDGQSSLVITILYSSRISVANFNYQRVVGNSECCWILFPQRCSERKQLSHPPAGMSANRWCSQQSGNQQKCMEWLESFKKVIRLLCGEWTLWRKSQNGKKSQNVKGISSSNWRCLIDILRRYLDMQVWGLGEKSGMDIYIW